MRFNAAEQLFLSERYPAAISALQQFIAQYPAGEKAPRATFYLAESLRATGRLESAADTYWKVVNMRDPDCREDALKAYAAINYDLQHYEKAVDAYRQLIDRTRSDAVRQEACQGLMRAAYGAKDYDEVVRTGQMVGTREARFLMAKSLRTLGQRERSRGLFEELGADREDAFGAESAYILIQDAFDRGDFDEVQEAVYAFSDSGSGQVYWMARCFIVLGDAFAARGDKAQAEATYNSILDGYQPEREDDDILEQVRVRLNQLKSSQR
jgi:TolA-binding protein